MTSFLQLLRTHLRVGDVLDVLVVAVLIYVALVWMRPRTSKSAVVAVLAVAAVYAVAHLLEMYLTLLLFRGGLVLLLVTLVVVFQADIRRAFQRLAAWPRFSRERKTDDPTVDTLAEAAGMLAEQRIGALIVLAGRENVGDHVRGGVPLDGELTIPLLHGIFHPATMGHDGAVLVVDDRVARFGVHLPLSDNQSQIRGRGTRHAAGLGLSERCDALSMVVSEERGTISLAHNGTMEQVPSGAALAKRLHQFRAQTRPLSAEPSRNWLPRNLGFVALSLALACGLWLLLAFQVETVQRVFRNVPVEYRHLPKNWSVVRIEPANVSVTITGTKRAFDAFTQDRLVLSLNLSNIEQGTQTIPITDKMLNLPAGLSVRQVDTQAVTLTAFEMQTVELPVRPQLEGRVPPGLTLGQVKVEPPRVRVIMRSIDRARHSEIPTERIWLWNIKEDTTLSVPLVLPPDATLPQGQRPTVNVHVSVSSAQRTP